MNEAGAVPQSWYAIVSNGSLISYLNHYRAMHDPSLEPLPSEGPDCAKLCSSTFAAFTDYEQVLDEARKLAEIMTGAMKVHQGPGNLVLKNIVGVYHDGEVKKFPPFGRPSGIRITLGRPVDKFLDEDVRETIEKSIVLFALRSENRYVRDVLRSFSQSDDYIGLYKIIETISRELNEHYGKKNGREKMVQRGWSTKAELKLFNQTVEPYRHRRDKQPSGIMSLSDAQRLVGRVIEAWLGEVAQRPPASSSGRVR